jgi:hypothetical protein
MAPRTQCNPFTIRARTRKRPVSYPRRAATLRFYALAAFITAFFVCALLAAADSADAGAPLSGGMAIVFFILPALLALGLSALVQALTRHTRARRTITSLTRRAHR